MEKLIYALGALKEIETQLQKARTKKRQAKLKRAHQDWLRRYETLWAASLKQESQEEKDHPSVIEVFQGLIQDSPSVLSS